MNGQRRYKGRDLLQISMPMGGIGAGCLCLSGYGAVQDFSIHNRPAVTAMPDGHGATEAAFALLHIRGRGGQTRLLEGPMPVEKIYDQGLQGQGGRKGGHEGLPRMAECSFTGAYPFGTVELADAEVPLKVSVTGFGPFIPLDDKNSGIPCAILEYRLTNTSTKAVEFEFSYHLSHMATGKGGAKRTRNIPLSGLGVLMNNVEDPKEETFGSCALAVAGHEPKIKGMWFRGGWFDAISAIWREVSGGNFAANEGNAKGEIDGRNGASVMVEGRVGAGETFVCPVIITWHFPNSNQAYGAPAPAQPAAAVAAPAGGCCEGGSACCSATPEPLWRPFYVNHWADAAEVARYVRDNYASLRQRTEAFRDALFATTAPAEVIDAVASNLAIVKSPTLLRQANGNVWGWEGCFPGSGCCHGSCTHVWNYAQALGHLFPALERTLREQEYLRSMDDSGHVNFRSALPDGPAPHTFHPAADGQLGGLVKLYRDWQESGDSAWLARLYPQAKKSLDYCIARWDPEGKGGLFEPHHNTYDIEFWGPDGMCGSMYVAALSAMAEMARALGEQADAARYGDLAATGAKFLDQELFNGQYYEQKVMWKDLRDRSFAELVSRPDDGDEVLRLLKAEGPKYQYGSGCLSDGVIGAWMAATSGLATPMTKANVRKHLKSIFKFNFKADLFSHVCLQRPGYALGHEPGLLLCTWPRGGKPTLPFVYSDEVWTGIEYQVASHMIEEGLVEEGLTIVRAARSRYDGHVRNPFNEYECGSYYARAMSSYALLVAMAGFRYSAVTATLKLAPKVAKRPFRTFFSTAGAFGVCTLTGSAVTVRVIEGRLAVREIRVTDDGRETSIPCDTVCEAGQERSFDLPGWGKIRKAAKPKGK